MKRALLATLALAALAPPARAQVPVLKGEQDFYGQGQWAAYNAPWSSYYGAGLALKKGVDFTDLATIYPSTFPGGTVLAWHWPLIPPKNAGVYSYDAISFGNYDGGHPPVAVAPKRVEQILSLRLAYTLAYLNRIGTYNVLGETFLTTSAGDPNTKAIEIGFLPHAPAVSYAWIKADTQLGTFTDASGRQWIAAQHAGPTGTFPYVTFSSPTGGDTPAATLDFLGAFRFLQGKGLVQPGWWFNGLAIGVEPITGSGWVMVKDLAIDYR